MVKNSVKRMRHFLSASVAISLSVALSGCGGEASTNTDIASVDVATPVEDWVMVWNDEFDSTSIDSSKWSYEVNCDGGGNNEQQCYTDSAENSFIADGNLNIVALPAEEGAEKPYTSARMVTQYKADFKYGRFEMRAKLPQGQGSWPAFWMMPTDSVYGGWPKSGEIDIVEAVNLKVTDSEGNEEAYVHGTLHYGQEWPNNASSGKGTLLPDGTNPADDFHTYAIEWQEGEIRWYIDDYLYQTQMMSEVSFNSKGLANGLTHRGWFAEYFDIISGELETHWDSAPFDQEFFMILNLAVGGDWPANVNDTGINAAAFENGQSYEVDYVRVYECASDPITGKGCETIRAGYKTEATDDDPAGALVIGKAPIPSIPVVGAGTPITIFADAADPVWPLWTSSGDASAIEVMDDEGHGLTAEFTLGANPTVAGFFGRDNGSYDGSGLVPDGVIQFEMKVVTAPSDPTVAWYIKVESAGGSDAGGQAADMILNTSNEGLAPVEGVWQTYTFSLQDFANAGIDLGAIDVLMIFPAWGSGEGTVYRVDNFNIYNPNASSGGSTVLADFEGAEDSYTFTDFNGGTTSIVANPDATGINTSAQVVKMEKFIGEVWGGTTLALDEDLDLVEGNTFTMKVWSQRAVPVLFKLEGILVETSITHSGTGWEELTFDFRGDSGVVTGVTIIFELGTMGDAAGDPDNWTFYFDDPTMVTPDSGNVVSDFENAAETYTFTDFNGGATSIIANPDVTGINTSAQVVKMEKLIGEVWGGTTLALDEDLDLVEGNSFTMKVWSQRAVPVLFKLEGILVETSVIHSGAGWEELTFDFSSNSGVVTGITIIFDLGTMGDAAGDPDNWTFYFDDINMVTPNIGTTVSDFENAAETYTFTDFNGGTTSILSNPDATGINTSTQVVKMEKLIGEVWGGTTLALDEAIDLVEGNSFTMKVWSQRSVPVLFKLEGILVETSVTHSGTGWEELTFDFSGNSGVVTGITIIFELGTMGDAASDPDNWTFYFDDISISQ